MELDALQKALGDIRNLGAELVALSPQTRERSVELIAQRKLSFDLLRDEGNEATHSFGLRFEFPADLKEIYVNFGIDLAASNGESSWTLPMPARYVVDASGTVRYARVHPDYTRRPEPDETVDVLRTVVG